MDRHDGFDPAEEIISLKTLMKIYRNQSGLPVMAVNDIRSETKQGHSRKRRLREEGKFLDILIDIAAVRLKSVKVRFVVDKIINHAVNNCLQNANVFIFPIKVHIKMGLVLHGIPQILGNAGILGQHHSNVKILFVYIFRKGTYHIGKSSCLDKRHAFRCNK